MEGGPPTFRQGFTCPALLEDKKAAVPVRGYHPLWPAFPDGSGFLSLATGLVRVRSPLLTESRLMSFPPVTEMVQFTGFASPTYVFSRRYRRNGGFPHSEISGSKCARHSPELIATCYVLHRLSTPRHPPDALLHLNVKLSRTDPRPRPPTIPPLPCERRKPTILARTLRRSGQTAADASRVQNSRPIHDVQTATPREPWPPGECRS